MQNILGPGLRYLSGDKIVHYSGNASKGWVDADDIAAVAAEALASPDKYAGKVIRMAYDVKNMKDIAEILSRVSGRIITEENRPPEEFLESAEREGGYSTYWRSIYDIYSLESQDHTPFVQTVFYNFEAMVGRPPSTIETFAMRMKDDI